MENDNLIETESLVETNNQDSVIQEDNSFEISEEAKEQSRKFFKFSHKPKKEKRKFESFEIVKTYTPKEKIKKDNDFNKILEISNDTNVDEESLTVQSSTKKQQVKLKMRPQGKLILICISVIIILLSSLMISNAVTLNKLNNSINNLNNEITIQDLNIDKAVKNLQVLNDDAKSDEQALKLELEKATETHSVSLYVRQETESLKTNSNWFDKLCNFISKIFGG